MMRSDDAVAILTAMRLGAPVPRVAPFGARKLLALVIFFVFENKIVRFSPVF
tara:strand:+ start:5790 stop:5945 length:156 start_codon:yes stop_codon:yes gene_type:complete